MSKTLAFRVSDDEYKSLMSAARAAGFRGRKRGEWIRRVLFAAAGLDVDSAVKHEGRQPGVQKLDTSLSS
jgi:hypothetical protein